MELYVSHELITISYNRSSVTMMPTKPTTITIFFSDHNALMAVSICQHVDGCTQIGMYMGAGKNRMSQSPFYPMYSPISSSRYYSLLFIFCVATSKC